jgi:regulator of ribonuclease activity A
MTRSICDLSDDHVGKVTTARAIFREFGTLRAFSGRIATLRCFEDNLLLRQVFSTPGNGQVMVVDGGGSIECALVGDKLAALMLQNHWAGVIVNGAVRDVERLREMPVGVRALNICPTKPGQTGSGERDLVVHFAGIDFIPGHWLYADENGILVSAAELH